MTVTSRDRLRRGAMTALQICAVAALYYASGKLGLLQQLVRGQVTPLWPASGIALAGLLLIGPRTWPGITLGAFLINISLNLPSITAVLMITTGDTLAPLCSYALLHRAGFRTRMNRWRDALALVFLGAFISMLISATVGCGTLHLTGALPGGFWPTWWVWWTGDAMGVLVVAPALLALRSARWPKAAPPSRWVEGSLLGAATISMGLLQTSPTPLLFLAFPLLTWAAFRFQRAGAAPCALAVSTFAIFAATRRSGPFAGHALLANMISLQAFNGAAALTALLLSAAITERNQTQEKIEEACRRLAEMVERTAPDTGGPPALPHAQSDGEENGGQARTS
ncbi:MASE1 domain-containing protein [Streptomyces sp. NBC_01320]|uniref:MASE1 domain-containing protein n=2 Tax=unclassified Streptomyces TaxID=2593676 RepID=UPI002E1015E1|nr:MASE1 domain-containing protein [Streptomyces sp. NBC_01320]